MNKVERTNTANKELLQTFPSNFIWGAATASYQVEGAAREDGRTPSIWDTFAATPGKVFQGHTGEVAANHYHLLQEDVDLMTRLHLGAYRFSTSWSRIIPQGRGAINQQGLDFYNRLVDALLDRGMQPFLTLYHWDLPQILQDQGGWQNRDTAYAFAEYAEVVARNLGDRVKHWVTENEPWCAAYLGYGSGIHAPGVQDRQAAMDAGHHLLLGHGLAVRRMRTVLPDDARVGIVLNPSAVYASDDRPETLRDTKLADDFGFKWLVDPLLRGQYPPTLFEDLALQSPPIQNGDLEIISEPIDFMGVNCYTRFLVEGSTQQPLADQVLAVEKVPGSVYTAMNWEVAPQGLHDLLVRLHSEYGVASLFVTENGAAFTDQWDGEGADIVQDPQRVQYLKDHIQACAEARAEGVPLEGYFVWSLLDNFEWAEGYAKRFGIVYVDYPTQRRVLKQSAVWYSSLIESLQAR